MHSFEGFCVGMCKILKVHYKKIRDDMQCTEIIQKMYINVTQGDMRLSH